MLQQIEGSLGVAQAVALCRPEVICAYPITPQTHIVENLGGMVRAGQVTHCEFINVESEFTALSVAIGASATGARSYTADFEVDEALEEGVVLNWLSTIKTGDNSGFTIEKMKLDEEGWPQPTGEYEEIEADTLGDFQEKMQLSYFSPEDIK